MKKLIAGNWKMNGSLAANEMLVGELLAGIKALASAALNASGCDVAVCVPAPYLAQISRLLNKQFIESNSPSAVIEHVQSAIDLGSQDVSLHASGAFTGEISSSMLKEFAVRYAIVGHSERRRYHLESDQVVSLKTKAALASGITPIVCVGETLEEREAGLTEAVVKRQLAAVIHDNGHCISEIVVAYEPVWAIGTGKTASPEQAQQVHAVLRAQLNAASSASKQRVRILYGGSMNAQNAKELLVQNDIDGGLIGAASLKAADFLQIVAAAQ